MKFSTLRSLYLDPLLDLLDSRNGSIFDNETLVLLLDFKSNRTQLLPYVEKHLEPFREKNYTTLRDGIGWPITIVASGNAPSDLPSDIFLDADISNLGSSNTSTAYDASASLSKALGSSVLGRLSSKQRARMQEQIQEAHEKGLKARYWDTPSWPVSRRNWFWETLVEEGVDVLNVDDLTAAACLDWGFVRWGWFDG
ncbi:hypothetical protein PRZ48_009890 [Zasmidium cellare]|uniref:Altered inheritance of mitochondria protein 6 n=1 Tax=Zasmidium cellare TaxID=395010 RepID=A0ABR0EDL7_ZASCE|nr:hypothetical protein PRZ48_009890 [Zasmidium cellare]